MNTKPLGAIILCLILLLPGCTSINGDVKDEDLELNNEKINFFSNVIKAVKSNAIAIFDQTSLVSQSGGQTSRIDSLENCLYKFNLNYLIAIAAGLGLYLELMIIRLHSSFFQLFGFFKNISLLSCLLGLGVGYLFGNKKLFSLKWVFPLLAVQISFMYLLKSTPLGPLLQNPISEQWAMGLTNAQGFFQFFIIYSFVVLIFLSNAVIFVPLGHLVSRLMQRQDKLKSYSWNLLGSISGILLFFPDIKRESSIVAE